MKIWQTEIDITLLNQRGKGSLSEYLGIEFIEVKDDALIARMPLKPHHWQPMGIMHGGVSCVLAETVGSSAANFCVTQDYYCVGLDINTNHIRSISEDEIAKAKTHADEVMAKINLGENFDKVALAESNSNQALQGGDLGWRKLPEIPTAFAEYVVKMKTNTTAGPIPTGNGFHIIRLVESRALNAKEAAVSRQMVESLLLQQKFEEAVQNWVSKLRSQAFVVVNT